MIRRDISDKILTIGPAPDMKGGIAQLLDVYFKEVFTDHKFIPETVSGRKIKRNLASVTALFKLIYKLAFDRDIKIVHLHTASGLSFARSTLYARVARLFGKKTILHVHGGRFKEFVSKNQDKTVRKLRKADRVVALSQTWKDYFERELKLTNVVKINNVFSKPDDIEKVYDNTPVNALFLGLINEQKGIYDLLDVIGDLKDRLTGNFRLTIGGNGETDKLNRLIKDKGIEDLVDFRGWISGQHKAELLKQTNIFILPSYIEGLPISILEAMGYKCAIIASNVGGIPEIVDESNGILMAPGDRRRLSEAIFRLVSDKRLLTECGKHSYNKSKEYMPDAVSQTLNALYSELLN